MRVGSIVVRVKPGSLELVEEQLKACEGVDIVHRTDEGFAIVVEADTPKAQRHIHEEISQWPQVEEALVVFQSSEVE